MAHIDAEGEHEDEEADARERQWEDGQRVERRQRGVCAAGGVGVG